MIILLVCFYLFFPAVILYFTNKYKTLDRIGAIIFAYASGLIFGNIGILPSDAAAVQDLVASISVPLSLPLLLFSMQIKQVKVLAGKALLSMLLSVISLIVVVYVGFELFGDNLPESYKTAGMLIGVYTGGTPNLASIKTALDVSSETYLLTHTYDTLISIIFILFFITIGQKVYGVLLPGFFKKLVEATQQTDQPNDDLSSYKGILQQDKFKPLLIAVGISVLILVVGGGISVLVPADYSMLSAILLITTLGILASLNKKINQIEKTFQAGMYFILIFSLDVASMAKFENIDFSSIYLLYFVMFAIFGTMLLHVLLSYLFKIDTDTTIITSTALICSPPFVPVVAGALKNKEIILPGLTVGIIGFAIGNYLGISFALLLK